MKLFLTRLPPGRSECGVILTRSTSTPAPTPLAPGGASLPPQWGNRQIAEGQDGHEEPITRSLVPGYNGEDLKSLLRTHVGERSDAKVFIWWGWAPLDGCTQLAHLVLFMRRTMTTMSSALRFFAARVYCKSLPHHSS